MRELSDNGGTLHSIGYERGYAAGYAAAQAACPPREPTRAMVAAALSATGDAPDGRIMTRVIWRAMHDAWAQEQTGRKGNKADHAAVGATAGQLDPTQGDFAEYLAPDHQSATARAWPFQRPPAAVAASLYDALAAFDGNMLAAVRNVFIENGEPLTAQAATDGPAADPIADLCAELTAQYFGAPIRKAVAALERLARENAEWKTWGIAEIAARNPSVMEYMRHWEGRAERAEAERDALLADAERYRLALRRVWFCDHNEREWASLKECQEAAQKECDAIDAARAKVKLP